MSFQIIIMTIKIYNQPQKTLYVLLISDNLVYYLLYLLLL